MIRVLAVCLLCLSMSSCNTLIGMGRDTKQAFLWTKGKMTQGGSGSTQQTGPAHADHEYDAPVY